MTALSTAGHLPNFTQSSAPPARPPSGPEVLINPAGEPDWHEFNLQCDARKVLVRAKVESCVLSQGEEVSAGYVKVTLTGAIDEVRVLLKKEGFAVDDQALAALKLLDSTLSRNVIIIDEEKPGQFVTGDRLNYFFAALGRTEKLVNRQPETRQVAAPQPLEVAERLGDLIVRRTDNLTSGSPEYDLLMTKVLEPYFLGLLAVPKEETLGRRIEDFKTVAPFEAAHLLQQMQVQTTLVRGIEDYIGLVRAIAGFLEYYLPAFEECVQARKATS